MSRSQIFDSSLLPSDPSEEFATFGSNEVVFVAVFEALFPIATFSVLHDTAL